MLHEGDLVKIKPFYLNPEACACSTIEDSVFEIDAVFNRDGRSMCAIEGFSFLLPEDAFIPVTDDKEGDEQQNKPISKNKDDTNKYAEWDALIDSIGKDDPPNAHYSRLDPQPIKYMQQAMTPEQFQGFCLGNVLKYALRFGHKDAKEKEAQKISDYAKWLVNSCKGEEVL